MEKSMRERFLALTSQGEAIPPGWYTIAEWASLIGTGHSTMQRKLPELQRLGKASKRSFKKNGGGITVCYWIDELSKKK